MSRTEKPVFETDQTTNEYIIPVDKMHGIYFNPVLPIIGRFVSYSLSQKAPEDGCLETIFCINDVYDMEKVSNDSSRISVDFRHPKKEPNLLQRLLKLKSGKNQGHFIITCSGQDCVHRNSCLIAKGLDTKTFKK